MSQQQENLLVNVTVCLALIVGVGGIADIWSRDMGHKPPDRPTYSSPAGMHWVKPHTRSNKNGSWTVSGHWRTNPYYSAEQEEADREKAYRKTVSSWETRKWLFGSLSALGLFGLAVFLLAFIAVSVWWIGVRLLRWLDWAIHKTAQSVRSPVFLTFFVSATLATLAICGIVIAFSA